MSNEELANCVSEELYWDPQIGDESITVEADDGVVLLRGNVESLRQKREAKKLAERVHGVKKVENDLRVQLMDPDAREDAELRAEVLHALSLDALVPRTIGVSVDEGVVHLTGTVEWQHQRAEVELVTADVFGVIDIVDKIEVTGPNPRARDVERSISTAFRRSAEQDADQLTIETSNGIVALEGTVRYRAEHDDAVAAAWAVTGVRDVDDRIRVEPPSAAEE